MHESCKARRESTRGLLATCLTYLGVFAILLGTTARANAATPAQVENAIKRGKDFLYSVQKNGNWETVPVMDANGGPASTSGGQFGGLTAIATYALLAAGEDPKEPRLRSGIEWLKKANITGTYALGMRAQVWQFLDPKNALDKDLKDMVRRDASLLAGLIKTQGPSLGFYDYNATGTTGRYDHSVSQYGVLGMWACAQTDFIEIPMRFWQAIEDAWVRDQGTGGWAYMEGKGTNPTPSMTAAGVATLFITQEYIHSMDGIECTGNFKNPHVEAGLKWMGDHFKEVNNNYTWYGVERIGVASGYKYFGTVDWFKEGAERLVKIQGANGGWAVDHGAIPSTSFALLFLVRGRAPVCMNKLDYTIEGPGKVTNWNQRPRDAANFARWLHKETETFFNWQIVNLKAPVDDLHESPILYVAGNQALNFTKEEEAKLREFVDGGGLVVFNADCAAKGRLFTDSILGGKAGPGLAQKLGYEFEWRKLPEDSPIYRNESWHRTDWKEANTLEVYALSNGSRELMILFSANDPARYWQTQTIGGREWAHQLMGDIFLYATDKSSPRYKGQTYVVHAKPEIKADKTLKIARIQYAVNWDPEPGGWRRLAAIVHNENKLDLTIEPVKLGEGKLVDPKAGYKLAHLTGNIKYHLTQAEKDELKQFVSAGGLLVVDACGGAVEFSDTMMTDLGDVFGDDAAQLRDPIKLDNPLFSAGGKALDAIAYRPFAKKLLGNTMLFSPRIRQVVRNKQPICYFSAEDLSVGMVGQEVDGIYGYMPATATAIMQKIVLQTAGVKSTPDTTESTKAEPEKTGEPPRKDPGKRPPKKKP